MQYLKVLLVSLVFFSSQARADIFDIQIPDNASTAWVSENINQDGMQLSIKTFRSTDSIEEVLSFYREVWHKDGDIPGYVENMLGDWSIISQLRDDSNVALQLKTAEDGSTEGFLSIALKSHGRSQPEINFPMPDGTEKFTSSYTEEDDAQVHTMTLLSTQSVGNAVNFYRSNMVRKGWTLAKDEDIEGNQIMLFNRKADRLELVISQLDVEKTVIHVNRVQRDG